MFPYIEHIRVAADLKEIQEAMTWMLGQIKRAELSSDEEKNFHLAFEEALVNIIRHSGISSDEQIDLILSIEPKKRIKLVILDRGKPFNPLENGREVDSEAPLEERKEGGIGLMLMSNALDEVLYERDEPFNVLTLVKVRK